jgi:hypothetical protein
MSTIEESKPHRVVAKREADDSSVGLLVNFNQIELTYSASDFVSAPSISRHRSWQQG